MKRKTNKELLQQLEDMRTERDKLYTKYYELKDEKHSKAVNDFDEYKMTVERDSAMSYRLQEIIRWLINNETARMPNQPYMKKDDIPEHILRQFKG